MIKSLDRKLFGEGRAYLASKLKLQLITEGKPRQELKQPVIFIAKSREE